MKNKYNYLTYFPKSILLSWLILSGCQETKNKIHNTINNNVTVSIEWETFLGSANKQNVCFNFYRNKNWIIKEINSNLDISKILDTISKTNESDIDSNLTCGERK